MLNDLDKDGVVGGLGSEVERKVAKRQAAEKPAKKLGLAAISGRLFLNCNLGPTRLCQRAHRGPDGGPVAQGV